MPTVAVNGARLHVRQEGTGDDVLLQLRADARTAGTPVVVISADATATHQSVVRVMEASRLAGLSQITFTTQATK